MPRVIEARRRHRSVDIGVETLEGFREHRTGRNAALLSHYGFLSVFPLILVLTTILGYILQNDASMRQRIVDSTLANLPIVGQQIASDPSALDGSILVLVFGLLAALWSGTKAFVGLQNSLNDIAEIPLDDRPNLAVTRLRALIGIGIIGGGQVGAAIVAGLTAMAGIPGVSVVLLLIATFALNSMLLLLSYHWLCAKDQEWRNLTPGAFVGGLLYTGLQLFGVTVVGRSITKATPAYGTFASVIGLIAWLTLHAFICLICAELNRSLMLYRDGAMPRALPSTTAAGPATASGHATAAGPAAAAGPATADPATEEVRVG